MAYFPRPDGLVSVDVGGGRLLPMSQSMAEAAGHGPAPAPMPEPVAAPNPYAGLPPDAVAGPGGGPIGPNPSALPGLWKMLTTPTGGSDGKWHPHTAGGGELGKTPSGPVNEDGIPVSAVNAANAAFSSLPPPSAAPTETEKKPEAPTGLRQIVPTAPRGSAPQDQGDQPARYVQTSPARDIRASYIVKPGVDADPDFAEYEKNNNPEYRYQDHLVDAQSAFDAREKARADDAARLNDEMERQESMRGQIAQNRAILQTKLDAVNQRQKEAEQATPQTRQEILASRGTLAGVMSGISIALGGWVQGLKGGSNPGLDIINQSIQDDISSQRSKYEAMKDRTAAANTAFGQAMKLYGDPNAAENDLYMRGLTLAANISANHWKQGENLDEMAKQKGVAQQLLEQAEERKQAAYTLLHGQVAQENYKYQPAQYAQVGGQAPDQPVDVEKMVTLPNGTRAWATTADAAKGAQETVSEAGLLDSQLGKLKKLTATVGQRVPTANERAQAETLKNEMFNTYRKLHGYSRFSEAEKSNFDKALGDQTDFFRNPNAVSHLEELRQQAANKVNATLGSLYTDPTFRRTIIAPDAGSFSSGGASPLGYPEQGPITMPKPKSKGGRGGGTRTVVVDDGGEEAP